MHRGDATDGVVPGEFLQLVAEKPTHGSLPLAPLRLFDVQIRSSLSGSQVFVDQRQGLEARKMPEDRRVSVVAERFLSSQQHRSEWQRQHRASERHAEGEDVQNPASSHASVDGVGDLRGCAGEQRTVRKTAFFFRARETLDSYPRERARVEPATRRDFSASPPHVSTTFERARVDAVERG
jgi:hypothetical protein